MADLPHVNDGYIQQESVEFRKSTDEQVYSQVGKNQNYLKDQADAAQLQASTLFMGAKSGLQTVVAFATDSNGNDARVIFTTPNGKPIIFALLMGSLGAYRFPIPISLLQAANQQMFGMYAGLGGQLPAYDGQIPVVQAQLTGANNESIYAAVTNGYTNGGKFGNIPIWAGGSVINYHLTVCYEF